MLVDNLVVLSKRLTFRLTITRLSFHDCAYTVLQVTLERTTGIHYTVHVIRQTE